MTNRSTEMHLLVRSDLTAFIDILPVSAPVDVEHQFICRVDEQLLKSLRTSFIE